MCGIIHCKRVDGKQAKRIIAKRYNVQKSRGSDGFGFVEIKNGIVTSEVRAEKEKEILAKLELSEADEILFHHRFPTSTPNFIEATHPIRVSHKDLKYDYYIVHNGIITNDEELRSNHIDLGFKYTTEIRKKFITSGNVYSEYMWNDSEALAIDFSLAIEKHKPINSKGSIAIVALQYDKKTKKVIALFYGRNEGNPLKMEESKDFFCISSESGVLIEPNVLFRLDYVTGDITREERAIGVYTSPAYDYRDYDDYCLSSGYKSNKKSEPEENDFDFYDLWEDIHRVKAEISQARVLGDYDLELQLEEELEELELIYEEKFNEDAKKWDI